MMSEYSRTDHVMATLEMLPPRATRCCLSIAETSATHNQLRPMSSPFGTSRLEHRTKIVRMRTISLKDERQ
jgi:hypothetical protein